MKKLGPRQRWLILGPLLIVSVAAAWLVDDGDEESARPRLRAERRPLPGKTLPAAVRQAESVPVVNKTEGQGWNGAMAEIAGIDPFRPKSWYVAPPPSPTPKPVAPPLPFRYLGQLIEEGETHVFVANQNRQLVLKPGDTIDGLYAVEVVTAGQVVFVYLPLKEKQILLTGRL